MAGMTLNQYFQQMENAIEGCDGVRAGELLSFNDPHVTSQHLQVESPESQCQRWFEPPWDELVAAHLRCCWAVANHNFIEAYGCQSIVVSAFVKVFQAQKDENWALPILFSVSLDIRIFGNNADTQLAARGRGKPGETLEKAADSLMACFRVCASDNRAAPDDSKKWGMLNLVNQLFKIYFKINKLHLCRPLTRAIESLPIREKFSISQMVTYRYYVGRKAIFDNDFKQADEYLSYAFQRCHRTAKCNKRLILIYLLPVKMLLGQMPKLALLKKYDLMQFSEVTIGVRSGNLLRVNDALEKNEAFFIRCGIYLILEKLKTITYRNIAKKVALILGTHQLHVSAFTTALRWMKVDDVDDDEVECILANLIYENKIKGYISHQHRKLVISKQNAFPAIAPQ